MARRIIAALMLTAVLCSTGCAGNVVTDAARSNLASFVVQVVGFSLDDALFPGD